jgi:hypothetical protein
VLPYARVLFSAVFAAPVTTGFLQPLAPPPPPPPMLFSQLFGSGGKAAAPEPPPQPAEAWRLAALAVIAGATVAALELWGGPAADARAGAGAVKATRAATAAKMKKHAADTAFSFSFAVGLCTLNAVDR